MRQSFSIFLILTSFLVFGQQKKSNYQTKVVAVNDSISIDSVSINNTYFFLKDKQNNIIDTSYYHVDFSKALLYLKKPIDKDSVVVEYLKLPDFLTKVYQDLNDSLIVENSDDFNKLLKLSKSNKKRNFTPFDGLTTSGSISRGVTVGSNQNSVLNSELDLQITGKLSDKVSLRASIQDANIPLQESGYSQRLDEFDQVFIELLSEKWRVRAGDIDLVNNDSYYAKFTKRVQGLNVQVDLGNEDNRTSIFASGALVRGQFSRSQFVAQEGNQGPYKLTGANGELFVLIVSGSESVYVNGVLLTRGENKDYIIDYNAGEIIFNSTFPITSEMRIVIDYQFSDRNYSRFIAYGGGSYQTEKLKINANVYSESDAKNQPLQQNLSTEQVQILADAGDDRSLMVAPSEVPETFNENRILYRKELLNGEEIFVFSNNPDDELFSVRFSLVGENQGNYIVSNTSTITAIYEYIAPINGVPQGSFEPIVQLIAPTRLQLAVINGRYTPSDKTTIDFELTGSKNDLNLFSALDDDDNTGFAAHIKANQFIKKSDSLWNINTFINADYIDKNFRTIEQLYNVEFSRDWNLDVPVGENQGDQTLLVTGINLSKSENGFINYQFEHLNYSETFNGNRHVLFASLNWKNWSLNSSSSTLTTNSILTESKFTRSHNRLSYIGRKNWAGVKVSLEDNEQVEKSTNTFTPLSQRFNSYEIFSGIGDSTNVFVEIGYKYRENDSLRANRIERVNSSNTYFINSRILKTKNTNLSLYANFRTLKSTDETIEDEQSFNSRLLYNQRLINQLVQLNTVFETNSGTLPQQEFTYVEVEPGQGAYTWIDYNENGIQELEEFEVAQFQDQGNYIRVLLPNQIFIKTHQNRLSQTLTINPKLYFNNKQVKDSSLMSKLYNQTSYLIDRKIRRKGNNFNLNPFETDLDDQLGLQLNFRNTLFFNRGIQRYTTSYTYLDNKASNLQTIGFIENSLQSHQIDFTHKIKNLWLITLQGVLAKSENFSENFATRNFEISEQQFAPKISYLLNDRIRFDAFLQYSNQENQIDNFEALEQQRYGVSFSVVPENNSQKGSISGEFNFISNQFTGNPNSPVGYQMMQGLQPGNNFTWNLLAQKKLTKYLDLNLNYFGRKSEGGRTIHTGNIQLRAYF